MPAAKRPPPPRPPPPPAADPIVDIEVDPDGTLHLVLANTGPAAAHMVRVRFSRALRDLAGLRVNDNPLFTHLGFLAAGRRVRLFVDTLSGYAKRRQPMTFTVTLTWLDDAGAAHRRAIAHDLTAWTQLRTTT
jgi:hypothetical protein